MDKVVIAGASRTAMGGFQGVFDKISAATLGGVAIKAALDDAGAAATDVDELLMGCVLSAGQGQAPARQAGFLAGLEAATPATTVNKMCGSGMKTVMMAHDQMALGQTDMMVAGGMESMSTAPYLLPKMRGGARIGHGQVVDHMFLDGLEDAYDKGRLMGAFAEDCAKAFQFTRQAQDEYALRSLSNARAAQREGAFEGEIAAVT
ncbi:MAG: beta-ketoacyl synthase N-terminal-like domain-containing protein, partial [Pseudomonadota bacterium]